jgi:hypothetical protein
MKKIITLQLVVMFFLGVIILTQLIGFSWSREEIFESCQPENIDYQSFGPYCLWIYTEQQTLGIKPLVLIAKKADPNGIHHRLYYPYPLSQQNISEINVSWHETGIEIKNTSDFMIMIPKNSFVGGR